MRREKRRGLEVEEERNSKVNREEDGGRESWMNKTCRQKIEGEMEQFCAKDIRRLAFAFQMALKEKGSLFERHGLYNKFSSHFMHN